MAPRSFWKGYLKLSLVTCPVAMIPARTDHDRIRFHTLNRKTGHRVESRLVDEQTNKPVPDEDQVKAWQSGDNDFVILEDEELAAAALESTRTIDIETFAPADSIAWEWYDQPHFLMPNDKVGEEAFAVIRAAMESTGRVGVARLVLYRRERAVLLAPLDRGIVLWTLRYGDEVRDPKDIWRGVPTDKPEATLMTMATKLIDERTKPWNAKMASDPVQANLAKIIASKSKTAGKKPKSAPKTDHPSHTGNVVSIFDALRKSIDEDRKRGG
jgi:DNA end-binding protein Ku